MNDHWAQPVVPHPLGDGVQVWRLPLASHAGAALVDRAPELLHPDELVRASAFRAGPIRAEFLAARGLLRLLLGLELGCGPSALSIVAAENGKPQLSGGSVEFNLSHSHGLILVALSTRGPVGVDLEYIDPAFASGDEFTAIARDTLSPDEFHQLDCLPEGVLRHLRFYQAWTRREAVAKADGRGLAVPLDIRFDEPSEPGSYTVSVQAPGDGTTAAYGVRDLWVAQSHAAALATPLPVPRIWLLDASRLLV